MESQDLQTIFGLLIIGILLGLIIGVIKLIIKTFSFLFKKIRRTKNRNSKPNRTDLIIQNRPGNIPNNFSHVNEKNQNHNQYPNYFE